MEETIKKVFSDEEYVKSLFSMSSFEEVQNSLEEKGIDISVEELRKIRDLLVKRAEGELTDKELEEVAGGLGAFGGLIIAIASGITLGLGISHTINRAKKC